MGKYKILDQHCLNYLTITVMDWVDVFIRKRFIAQKIGYIHNIPVMEGLVAVVNLPTSWVGYIPGTEVFGP